jgi:hypothetical protein
VLSFLPEVFYTPIRRLLLPAPADCLAGRHLGLVEGFDKWLLHQGYSLASVNNRLSAVKVYARLAAKAGVIPLPNML